MMDKSDNYFDSVQFRRQGHQLVDFLADYLKESTGEAGTPTSEQVLDYCDENSLYEQWKSVKPGQLSFQELIQRVVEQSIRLHHPRYMGHQISPPANVAALSGLVSDVLNNGMGVYEMGMAGTVLERVIVELVGERFGFAGTAVGFLTSGGSLGNLTALLAARNSMLGSNDEPVLPSVMVSEQAHYCVQRAVSIMGWGKGGLITVLQTRNSRWIHTNYPNCCNGPGRQGVRSLESLAAHVPQRPDPMTTCMPSGNFARSMTCGFMLTELMAPRLLFPASISH